MDKEIKSTLAISYTDISEFHRELANEISKMQERRLSVDVLFSTAARQNSIVYSAVILGRG